MTSSSIPGECLAATPEEAASNLARIVDEMRSLASQVDRLSRMQLETTMQRPEADVVQLSLAASASLHLQLQNLVVVVDDLSSRVDAINTLVEAQQEYELPRFEGHRQVLVNLYLRLKRGGSFEEIICCKELQPTITEIIEAFMRGASWKAPAASDFGSCETWRNDITRTILLLTGVRPRWCWYARIDYANKHNATSHVIYCT